MNTNAYLSNPIIPKGYYMVKCTAVEVHPTGGPIPLVVARLVIIPRESYGDASQAVLHVTLRGSQAAAPLHQKFRGTFGATSNYKDAEGRFASVLVKTDTHKGIPYSGVHFTKQSSISLRQSKHLAYHDQQGNIDWDDPQVQPAIA